jgi:DNA-binding NtrC family response regulator
MARKQRPLRVLVVDDELLIRWAIAETLGAAGHTVIEAADGAAALRALSGDGHAVDAVVLDYRLPDSNDLSLLTRIRSLAPGRPVIMMSAYGTPDVVKGARDLGVYDVLSKPFDMHELEQLLVKACDVDSA